MQTTERPVLVEPTKDNIAATFKQIEEWAAVNGYQIHGELKLPSNILGLTKNVIFESRSIQKVVRTYLTRLNKRVTMGQANRFLHMFFRKVLKSDQPVPRVDYSEKELEIKAARKEWRIAMRKAEELCAKYKEVKGDFYKKK